MLFEGWPRSDDRPDLERLTTLGAVTILAGLLYCGLTAVARNAYWMVATPDEWVAYVGLNAIGAAVILHAAIGARWPFIPGACRERMFESQAGKGKLVPSGSNDNSTMGSVVRDLAVPGNAVWGNPVHVSSSVVLLGV